MILTYNPKSQFSKWDQDFEMNTTRDHLAHTHINIFVSNDDHDIITKQSPENTWYQNK